MSVYGGSFSSNHSSLSFREEYAKVVGSQTSPLDKKSIKTVMKNISNRKNCLPVQDKALLKVL